MFFTSDKDFEKALHIFMKNIESQAFSPRKYCLENLSDDVCTKQYLSIISDI